MDDKKILLKALYWKLEIIKYKDIFNNTLFNINQETLINTFVSGTSFPKEKKLVSCFYWAYTKEGFNYWSYLENFLLLKYNYSNNYLELIYKEYQIFNMLDLIK
jgi:hypothetical protein